MKLQEFLKKPLRPFIENNIVEDVIAEDKAVTDLINLVTTQLTNKSRLDFLVVITDQVGKPKAVITHRDVDKFIQRLKDRSGLGDFSTMQISKLELQELAPPNPIMIERDTDSMEKAYDLFHRDITDTIIAVDSEGKYIGKVKRNSFVQNIDDLTS